MEKRIELEKRGRPAEEVCCNEKRQNNAWSADATLTYFCATACVDGHIGWRDVCCMLWVWKESPGEFNRPLYDSCSTLLDPLF